MHAEEDLASFWVMAAMAMTLYSENWAEAFSHTTTGLAEPSKSRLLKKQAELKVTFPDL